MDRPDREPDEIRIGDYEISGSRRVPERLVATDTRGLFLRTVHEYTKVEAHDEAVWDRRVIEIWHEPEGDLAAWRWLSELTELERLQLMTWYEAHRRV